LILASRLSGKLSGLRTLSRKCRLRAIIHKKEKKMSIGTKDEVKGTAHEVKGTIKAVTGKVTGDSKLEAEGHAEKTAGKIQKKIGQVEKVLEK
jgi:uncharacterized protein YjbJ (UPF0337 family)